MQLVDWLTGHRPHRDAVHRPSVGQRNHRHEVKCAGSNALMRSVLPDAVLDSDVKLAGPISVQISSDTSDLRWPVSGPVSSDVRSFALPERSEATMVAAVAAAEPHVSHLSILTG